MSKIVIEDSVGSLQLKQGDIVLSITRKSVGLCNSSYSITHNSFEAYQQAFPPVLPTPLNIFPDMKVHEVGPGLGGLLVALHTLEPNVGLTAIDPAAFGDIRDVLGVALSFDHSVAVAQKPLLETLFSRAEFILGPQVNLINTTLERAVEEHPELLGTAHLVVDYCGATTYSDRWQLEELLWINPPNAY